MPTWQRRRSLRACLPDQAGGASEEAPPARRGGRGARATWHSSRCNSYRDSRCNSVHKCPKTAPRGHFHRFVYTPASLRLLATAQQPNSVHKRPNPARRGPIFPFVYTIAIPRPPTTQAHGATVYTNALKRHREAILADLCTLLRHRPGGEAHIAGAVTQPPTRHPHELTKPSIISDCGTTRLSILTSVLSLLTAVHF